MDILSFGLASQADKLAKGNEEIIGAKAEGRHKTVAARLLYLENQAAGLLVDTVRQVAKDKTALKDVEIHNSTFRLKPTPGGFKRVGTVTTGVIDLGEGIQDVYSILVEQQKVTGQHITVKAAYSSDNVTWSDFATLPLPSIPKVRYWKLTLELKVDAGTDVVDTTLFDSAALSTVGEVGLTEASGTAINSYNKETHAMTGVTVDETSTLYSVTFEKPSLGKIGKVILKEG